jgi:spore maturation protein CgeB
MKAAQIVVHANPGNWEGDFRLWESLCSKALVFVDYMYVPHSHPLTDGEDVVFYDPLDKQNFMAKVKYYLMHHEEARRIAMNGFYKAMRHHRYINRVDYILNTVSLLTDPSYKVRPGS